MTPRRPRRWVWIVAAVLFAASAAYLAATFQWRAAFALLAGMDVALFVGGSGAALLAYWALRAFRWRLLMRAMGVRTDFVSLYLCSSVALSLSVLTPLQSGEVLKVELLRKISGGGRLPGYSAFALERFADLYAIAALGLAAAAAAALPAAQAILVAILLVALPVATFPATRIRLPAGRLGDFVRQMREGVASPGALALFMAVTFASWLMVAAAWHACLSSVAISLALPQLLGLLSVVTLATILSFVPAGLGIAEAGISGVLIQYGVDAPLAQAGALVLRAFSVLVVVLGAVHLLWLRLHWREDAR